ncbi:LA2681 family HEPN domain-containing protein [Bacillus inaquosorum]|uniref:LA2681 family HEPN domain-containing protein n=1 Tax=Bacillus inaquosorum TaxID=483913 RepID=UPI0022813A5C|nr:LA2681 family HEPN domain-containing protein [Bacillus inaquosorum]MCY8723303.1 LA2681 family HEPN domain-containing protein [Bacillus inaquosorum]MEC0637461.1 LA2681 family HEPN domain-containing protein [Bacillus inaquosorum]
MLEEIMKLGSLIDELDSNMLVERASETNLNLVKIIEEKVKDIGEKKLNLDEVIPFKYTESNYYAILMKLAWDNFDKVKAYSNKLSEWNNYSKADLEIKIERIKLYREALEAYDSGSIVAPEYVAQISTNLGNLYHEMGRIVESVEVLSKTFTDTNEFPMALGNHGIKCYTLATYSIDSNINKYLLNLALEELNYMLENVRDSDLIVPEHITMFEKWKEHIVYVMDNELKEVKSWEASMDVDIPYKNWCSKKQLSLNYINIVKSEGNIDSIHIPDMGIGYFGEDDGKMTYYSWFNTIKQEFNLARYNLYLIETSDYEFHESQQHNVLINTLDYPAVGYKTELLKTSLKAAYGILDKIGLFCSHFFKVNAKPGRIDFNKWYKEVEIEIALDSPFNALYWLSKDLDFKTGYFKDIRRLRNVIEHRYVRILDYYDVSISDELKDTNKYEYIISYEDLYDITIETLKLVRSAIFYMVNGFNVKYKHVVYRETPGKIFLPLYLDVYDDEWKN